MDFFKNTLTEIVKQKDDADKLQEDYAAQMNALTSVEIAMGNPALKMDGLHK